MTFDLSPETLTAAGLIFVLRVLNNAIGTVRLVMLARGQKWSTAILGFIEALIFAITVGSVVQDLTNIVMLAAYCLGFSVGSWLGLMVEGRFIVGYLIVNVFSHGNAHQLAIALREQGFGVTETIGEGHQGEVRVLRSVVNRRDVSRFMDKVNEIEPSAFVAVEEARSVQRGTIRAVRNQPY